MIFKLNNTELLQECMIDTENQDNKDMIILEPHDEFGWITAIICGRWVQAKVYDKPSEYGINSGRVSKLVISKTNTRNPHQEFFPQMCYNYDRGLDFNHAGSKLVNQIVAQLEKLPRLDSDDKYLDM